MTDETQISFGKTVPHNSDIEAGIIGAVLRNNDVLLEFEISLFPEMFYVPAHRQLWTLITEQIKSGNPATPTTLLHFAESMEVLKELGGAEYLAKLTFEAFSIISPKRYVEILIDLYHKREIIRICEGGITESFDIESDESAHIIADRTETRLFQLEAQNSRSRTFSLAQSSQAALEEIGKVADGKQDLGVSTGFSSLKNVMGGLRRSDLIILAARPAMGKTSLAMNIAFNAAKDFSQSTEEKKKSVVFFSLEMSAEQLSMRILSDRAGIPFEKFRLGTIGKREFERYKKTQKEISPYPLYIEENPGVNLAEMRATLRKIHRQNPIGAVFLDYLQLLSSTQKGQRPENRVQELSEITRGLKLLAREFDVPIVVLSQLSRAVESRDNKTPILADLRESGSIEQDADMVLFIYRPEYYLKEPQLKDSESEDAYQKRLDLYQQNRDTLAGKAEVIIAKNRHGAPTKVEMIFNKELIRFSDPEYRFANNKGIPVEG